MTAVLHSIQSRIVMGGVVIAAVVLAVLGGVVRDQLREVAGASVASLAREELAPYVTGLRDRPADTPVPPPPGRLILVVDPDGGVVIDTTPPGVAAELERGGTGMSRVHAGGVSYAAAGATVSSTGGTWRLWALRDSASADRAQRDLEQVLLLDVPLLLLLVAVGSWVLVGVAFRPVRRLRTAAERIARSAALQRLPEGRGRDELAALARTLNGFLDAQRASVERERRMVAEASHELRTPLAVLMAQLDLAEEQRHDRDGRDRMIRDAREQVRALSRLATQLLELARLESEPGRPAGEISTVRDLVSETMAAVDRARTVAAGRVRVDLELDEDLREEDRVALDSTAFRRVVDNLTTNAVHATGEGSVVARLARTPTDLVLTVTDSGTGVPEEFLPHAFERFTRSDRSRASGVVGSGLGLALVQALLQAAGGSVTLANRIGGGAVATARVPFIARSSGTG